MQAIVGVTRTLQCPWILAADFNMEPELLQSHTLYGELGGMTVRPDTGTCKVHGRWVCYDYFVVDSRLGPLIESVIVMTEAHTSPHLPVRLRLRANVRGLVQRVLVVPRALPLEKPVGCSRQPAA